jgi:hypothetical protein
MLEGREGGKEGGRKAGRREAEEEGREGGGSRGGRRKYSNFIFQNICQKFLACIYTWFELSNYSYTYM